MADDEPFNWGSRHRTEELGSTRDRLRGSGIRLGKPGHGKDRRLDMFQVEPSEIWHRESTFLINIRKRDGHSGDSEEMEDSGGKIKTLDRFGSDAFKFRDTSVIEGDGHSNSMVVEGERKRLMNGTMESLVIFRFLVGWLDRTTPQMQALAGQHRRRPIQRPSSVFAVVGNPTTNLECLAQRWVMSPPKWRDCFGAHEADTIVCVKARVHSDGNLMFFAVPCMEIRQLFRQFYWDEQATVSEPMVKPHQRRSRPEIAQRSEEFSSS
ncbi:hypothetical protein C8F04DRAFT_1189023 [Mycena alexandri]|uniref:Uncharacterized protein n=1 Tax=Mycena alexandri TaxID=1745969 RepID=A0AAD6WX81_9AGAR|nr:hypothetical protein C8F04DRAFT_1189023 [Mycena alexandri]